MRTRLAVTCNGDPLAGERVIAEVANGRTLVESARISRIATAPEFTPPVIYSNAQRARLVYLVEARPEPAAAARLRPGQPLDVTAAPAAVAQKAPS